MIDLKKLDVDVNYIAGKRFLVIAEVDSDNIYSLERYSYEMGARKRAVNIGILKGLDSIVVDTKTGDVVYWKN